MCFDPEWVDYVVGTYGVRRFLADLDDGRAYPAEAGLVASCLRHVSREGFADFCERHDFAIRSPREYRERYILEALRGPKLS